jgi:two-component system, chemotaxis family, chemotaxis protein CheY
MIELALGEIGYTVVSAPDVATAVGHARAFRPALILLDVRLRGETAGEFIAEYEDAGSQPIIVMTASQNPVAAAEQLGAAGWLAKPFNLDDLFALVRHHVPAAAAAVPLPLMP